MIPDGAVEGYDGLPITKVGTWTLEKHERLIKYVGITRDVRRKFANTEATYIELFCGPGRSQIEETAETIDGSPVIAARTAKDRGTPFTDLHLADSEPTFVDAARTRLPPSVGRIHSYVGVAESTVNQVILSLNPEGLHFAFLGKLDPLPFLIIEKLAKLKRMDMLIHVSIHDFQRNLRLYMEEHGGPLDRFAPGWRAVIDSQDTDKNIRIKIFKHWLELIRNLDMKPSEGIELVSGTNKQPLYWLVLVARHPLAHKFWNAIRNVTPQGRLGL
jgi:three-Cys-motif partner protein